jgi:hypothetical protein
MASTKLSQAVFRLLYLSETSENRGIDVRGKKSECRHEVKKRSETFTTY